MQGPLSGCVTAQLQGTSPPECRVSGAPALGKAVLSAVGGQGPGEGAPWRSQPRCLWRPGEALASSWHHPSPSHQSAEASGVLPGQDHSAGKGGGLRWPGWMLNSKRKGLLHRKSRWRRMVSPRVREREGRKRRGLQAAVATGALLTDRRGRRLPVPPGLPPGSCSGRLSASASRVCCALAWSLTAPVLVVVDAPCSSPGRGRGRGPNSLPATGPPSERPHLSFLLDAVLGK